jgi:uncharacterized LabA/DUF88 family protein
MEKISIYIDSANFDKRLLDFGFHPTRLDLLKFLPWLYADRDCVSVNYYVSSYLPFPDDPVKNQKYKKQQNKFRFWRERIPNLNIHEFEMKKDYTRPGKYRERRVDNAISGHMIRDAYLGIYDTAVLLSSDPDFVPDVKLVKEARKKVELVLPNFRVARELSGVSSVNRIITMDTLEASKWY